ncbi:MAG: hypothetical protein HYR72_05300 [Deltaproteobacteria bacterium]|nr:hypothetical protein [Deltaproteobacteria bacterium]MBI3389695.1 hypothetical protein [Deltaproteobacteria bacterium]
MSTQGNGEKKERSWPAVVGWGSLALFSIGFVWVISTQLGESWSKREEEAKKTVREYKPDNTLTLDDMTKVLLTQGTDVDVFVGEFSWESKQKDGPEYEVILTWREGNHHRQAVWRIDLKNKDVRPQGDEAAAIPKRAAEKRAKGGA